MTYVRALRALPTNDRRSLLTAAVLLAPTRVALRLVRVATVKRAVGRAAGVFVRRPSTRDAVRRIPWAVTTAGRHVPGGRHCLAKAIVAKALLDAEGIPVRLRVGVRRDRDGVLRGHAWLDGDDGLVMDAGEDPVSFVPLPALQEAIDGRR